MAEQTNTERLAEILWTARKIAIGYGGESLALADAPARLRTQYQQFAEEVAKQLDLEELRADSNKLRAMEAAGVDNWDGYSYAMEILGEVYGDG